MYNDNNWVRCGNDNKGRPEHKSMGLNKIEQINKDLPNC